MLSTSTNPPQAYTPEQVATMLQLSKNTVYQLISSGEIIAKKFGKVYRISPSALSYLFFGLDNDFVRAEENDLKNLTLVTKTIADVRKML
ncbi:MAG: hypothetical protein UW16_C0031G0009 [Microgenomates group bacterium GW2011_GWC1_44_10]|nr:MAG: hypothetical protein UW16_C0031G0009 [Microgenomates group bacterium GW2011_GWC1_44_10]